MTNSVARMNYRIEKLAPEGGWGYLVGLGLTLPFACGLGSLHSFGLMFTDFLSDLGAGASAITLVNGVFFSALSFAGLCASPLIKKSSMRTVGLLGAVIYLLGSLMVIFVTSVETLILAFGILQGFGLGLMVPVGYTNFNLYFVKKRVFMMSCAQALKGVLITLHPIMVNFTMNMYGFRGSMAIIAAINAHSVLGMIAMHPIEWHYKVIKVAEVEMKPLMENGETEIKNEILSVVVEDQNGELLENEKTIHSNKIETIENGIKDMKTKRSKSFGDPTNIEQLNAIQDRVISMISLNDLGGDMMARRQSKAHKNGIWQTIVEYLDLTLLKDLVYVNMMIGVSTGLFSDNIFSSLLPAYIKSLGFSIDDAAMVVSIGTSADMISRFSLAILSSFITMKARNIFLAGVLVLIVIRTIFLYVYSFMGLMIIMACIGFFRTWLHLPMSLIFAEYLPSERFASGYGLFMFLQGNFTFVFGPLVGWVRDVTQSYVAFVYSVQLFMFFCAIPWIAEMIWVRCYRKKEIRT